VQRAELGGRVAGGAGADPPQLKNGYFHSLALEQERGREADDAGAHDGHVRPDVAVERRTPLAVHALEPK
jgi:hypothetical protein